jgi:hypothetical protein
MKLAKKVYGPKYGINVRMLRLLGVREKQN